MAGDSRCPVMLSCGCAFRRLPMCAAGEQHTGAARAGTGRGVALDALHLSHLISPSGLSLPAPLAGPKTARCVVDVLSPPANQTPLRARDRQGRCRCRSGGGGKSDSTVALLCTSTCTVSIPTLAGTPHHMQRREAVVILRHGRLIMCMLTAEIIVRRPP